jgi:ribosomal protein S18
MRKFTFLAGAAIGYLFGTAAGRKQFDKIKGTATQLWENPQVQKVVDKTKSTIDQKAPESMKSYLKDSGKAEESGATGDSSSSATGTTGTSTGGVTTSSTNPATGTPTPSS